MLSNKNDREKINAVHDDELVNFLMGIDMYHPVIGGVCKCKFCKKTITLQNITTVFPESGEIKFVCDDMKCALKFRKYLQENHL